MAVGRSKPEQNEGTRTTSYPQGQEGKAPVAGRKRTSSYQNSIQTNTRGYETIN